MELKVKTPTFPEVIEFNFQELKQEITEKASTYVNLVYSDDQIADAKKDRATLNKFVKALSDERIKIKKECLKPYEDFEVKIKELDGIVSAAIKNIDGQIKAAEEQKKAEKLEAIKAYWQEVLQADKVPEAVTFNQIFDEKWLNASVSMKSIQESIDATLTKIAEDLATLENLPEFGFEAKEVYKTTFDLNKALNEGRRLSEIAKRKAEYEAEMKAREEERARLAAEAEAKKQEERLPGQVEFHDAESFEKCVNALAAPQKQWVSFKALLTVDEARDLKKFFDDKCIEYEAI